MKIDVSIGELVDKVTILSIKLKKIKCLKKLNNIQREYALLQKTMELIGITQESVEFKDLENINLKLWDIEDRIRLKEAARQFDDEFIDLARSVYFTNDNRAEIKKRINIKFGSELVEEKEYQSYGGPAST